MDPVAHTLVGAVLAESGLKKVSRYATATLLIGVNLPDIDSIAMIWGKDTSLFFRRGWSHGIVAMIILPLLLYAGISAWQRWRGSRVGSELTYNGKWILALAYLSLLTHPLLDWMNTYGVRLLMPFDQRWFYGDTLFIIDPWVWLMLAGGILLARKINTLEWFAWGAFAVLSTLIIIKTSFVSDTIKLIWIIGIATIAGIRFYLRNQKVHRRFAQAGLALLIVYVSTVYGFARVTENAMSGEYGQPLESQVNPMPGMPFSHRSILVYPNHYKIIDNHGCQFRVDKQQPDAIVEQAMQSKEIRGFINWMRYPYWEKVKTDSGWLVKFRDLRYQGPAVGRQAGIGFAEVLVPFNEVNQP